MEIKKPSIVGNFVSAMKPQIQTRFASARWPGQCCQWGSLVLLLLLLPPVLLGTPVAEIANLFRPQPGPLSERPRRLLLSPKSPSGARTATELPPMSYAGFYSTQVPHSQDGSRPSPACGVTLRRFPLPFWQVCLSL